MANERIPEDPYRSGPGGDDFIRSSRYDRELPPLDRDFDEAAPSGGDFDEAASSGGKVALFAVAIALVLGAVFYGLNNTSTHQAANPPPSQTAQPQQGLPQSPGTPRANTQPGMTTGAAPSHQAMPPTAPSTMDRQPTGEAPKQ
jgi:hypothetical protein